MVAVAVGSMNGNGKGPAGERGQNQNFGTVSLSSPIGKVLSRLEGVKGGNSSWTARCPGHDDKHNSLSVSEANNGKVLLNCHAGCETVNILAAMDLEMKNLFPDNSHRGKQKNEIVAKYDYVDESGKLLYQAVRLNPKGFYQRRPVGNSGWINNLNDTRRVLYRLPQVIAAVAAGEVIHVVEGEKDADALMRLGLTATCNCGGAGKWRPEYSKALSGARVVVLSDNDDPGRRHAEAVKAALEGIAADVKVIHLPGLPAKGDVSDWIAAGGTAEKLHELIKNPPSTLPAKDFSGSASPKKAANQAKKSDESSDEPTNEGVQQFIAELRQKAATVLEHSDPIELVKDAAKALGYGGKIETVVIVYLAITSRLLAMRRGSMPVHLILIGQPSAGKSFAVGTVINLLPKEAVHLIDAGSPRALIYSDAELKHRVIFFGEADSLPTGEDNPAASAVRNLLQEHRLHYQVVEAGKGNRQSTRIIEKEGPTALITTAVKPLGEQLMSRLFRIDVPDDQNQIRAALRSQASLELHGAKKPNDDLIAYQAYLQQVAVQEPFDVIVPYADALAEAIGRRPAAARITRDYARLLSLIKSVAVLRHHHRQRTDKGRIIADIADYQTVYDLIGDMFETSVTGASKAIRETVETVSTLIGGGQKNVTAKQIAEAIGISNRAATTRARNAIKGNWLINNEERRGRPYKLVLGEKLPETAGLPTPQEVVDDDPAEPFINGGFSTWFSEGM